MTTRREFIRQVGVFLTSLTATHCAPLSLRSRTPRGRLRRCWLELDRLEKQMQKDFKGGEETMEQLLSDHRAALDELVQAGELDAAEAEYVHAIFDEATRHIHSSMMTCYEAMPMPDYRPAARGQVIQQTDLLAEMAKAGDLDPQTVAQAQAALERDATFLSLSSKDEQALYDELTAAGTAYPSLDELDLDVPPEAAEAAAFLIDVLTE